MTWLELDRLSDSELNVLAGHKVMNFLAWDYLWSPATDIASAFQILDRVRSDHRLNVVIEAPGVVSEYRVQFWSGLNTRFSAENKTLPRAIVIAALLAIGVEKP